MTMTTRTVEKYETTATAQRIADRVHGARHLLVVTHDRPDGDAIGSTLAFARAARSRGVHATIMLTGPFDPSLRTLLVDEQPLFAPGSNPPEDVDLIAVLDTGAWSQLEHLGSWLRTRIDQCVGVDHHRTGDTGFADRIVDVSSASCTQVLIPIIQAMGVRLDTPGTGGAGSIAEALFAGLATDTGWFRFSSADAAVFSLASRLIGAGVQKDRLYRQLEETARPQRMGLLARALGNMKWVANGRAAVMILSPEDFTQSSGSAEDLAGVVNAPMTIGQVEVSALLSLNEPGPTIKFSLRSKPPAIAGGFFVDVNRLANEFGGGGHVHAAGAKFKGTMAEASAAITKALERALP